MHASGLFANAAQTPRGSPPPGMGSSPYHSIPSLPVVNQVYLPHLYQCLPTNIPPVPFVAPWLRAPTPALTPAPTLAQTPPTSAPTPPTPAPTPAPTSAPTPTNAHYHGGPGGQAASRQIHPRSIQLPG